MRFSHCVFAATLALGTAVSGAWATPVSTFAGTVNLNGDGNFQGDLTRVTDFQLGNLSPSGETGSFVTVAPDNNQITLATTDLNLRSVTSFQITGSNRDRNGPNFGSFTGTSYSESTTAGHSSTSFVLTVFGNYAETYSTSPLPAGSPNADIVFTFTETRDGNSDNFRDTLSSAVMTVGSSVTVSAQSAVPEPASLAVLSAGILGLGAVRRRRRAG